MSNPFGAFTPSTKPEVVDAEFEEIAPTTPVEEEFNALNEQAKAQASTDNAEVLADIEAVLDEEVVSYRQQLGLISPGTMSKILGVHQDTLKGWRSEGKGPPHLKIGKRVWYLYELVQDWLPSLSQSRTGEEPKEKTSARPAKEGLQEDEHQSRPEREHDQSRRSPGERPEQASGPAEQSGGGYADGE
jgi:hypothetical protein